MNNGYYFRYLKELKNIEKELTDVFQKLKDTPSDEKRILYYAKYLLLIYKVFAINEVLLTEMNYLKEDSKGTFKRYVILNVARLFMFTTLDEKTMSLGLMMSSIVSLYDILCFGDVILKYHNMDKIAKWSNDKSKINEIIIQCKELIELYKTNNILNIEDVVKYSLVNDMIIEYAYLDEELPKELDEETKKIISSTLQVDLNSDEKDYITLLNKKRKKEKKLFGVKVK